ncbi:peptidase C56 [Corynebacterium yudongzhengii]|uniref:Type 1 glutamine amidotransferase n=1 Tax=Corynebacterium yudongzhengii TaxID=2080740 RepID=A0A2U1T7W3_9CORY|nr:type 1 glutamine amidotransferase domain-containing protein [Corynebacterium yudongzhengii]AWB82287.1 peptidase C56 [Corynebacterium yudongzhengii]PWC02094.1 type 1 glutamine amidotransferase [Corynebacterium yudongzhengii]
MAENLNGKTIAVIATDGFEDSELSSPVEAVRKAGADVVVLSTEAGTISGKNGTEVSVDKTTADARGEDFHGIILPGGTGNADKIRMDEAAVEIVKKHVGADKPLGVICHGAWILTDADVLRDRTLTSYPSLKTDLRNAGATWVDEEVHCDQGLVSSRTPDDLPAFNDKIVEEFAEGQH